MRPASPLIWLKRPIRAGLLGLPIDDLEALVDVTGLAQPIDGLVLAADLVDELELERLATGEDAALHQPWDLVGLDVASALDQRQEPAEALVDHRLGDLGAFLAQRLEGGRDGFEVTAFDLVHLDADLVQHLRDFRPLDEHADRACDRILARDDVVGAKPDDVAGRGGNRAELGDDRFLLGELAQGREQRLAARRGATGAVHEHQHCLDVLSASPMRFRSSSWSRLSRIVPSTATRAICLLPN